MGFALGLGMVKETMFAPDPNPKGEAQKSNSFPATPMRCSAIALPGKEFKLRLT
jgi:hypothetical protein